MSKRLDLPDWCLLDGRPFMLSDEDYREFAKRDRQGVVLVLRNHPDPHDKAQAAEAIAGLPKAQLDKTVTDAGLEALAQVTLRTVRLAQACAWLLRKATGADSLKDALAALHASERFRLKKQGKVLVVLGADNNWVQVQGPACPRSAVRARGPSMHRSGSQRRSR